MTQHTTKSTLCNIFTQLLDSFIIPKVIPNLPLIQTQVTLHFKSPEFEISQKCVNTLQDNIIVTQIPSHIITFSTNMITASHT